MTQENIIIMIVVAIVALIIGLLIGKGLNSGNNDKAVQTAQKELSEYKEAVSEHFGKTADLVDNLTQSYKEVFDHLGHSAKDLLSEEQVKQHLASRAEKAITLTYLAETTAGKPTEDKPTEAVKQQKENPTEQAKSETPSDSVAETETTTANTEKVATSGKKNEEKSEKKA